MIYPNPEEGKSALVSNCGCIEVDYWNCQGLFCGCVSIFTSLFTVEGLVCVSLHLHTAALIIVFFSICTEYFGCFVSTLQLSIR